MAVSKTKAKRTNAAPMIPGTNLIEAMSRRDVDMSRTFHDETDARRGDTHHSWHFVVAEDAHAQRRAGQELVDFAKRAHGGGTATKSSLGTPGGKLVAAESGERWPSSRTIW